MYRISRILYFTFNGLHGEYKYSCDNEFTMTSVGVDFKTNLLDYINRVLSLANVLWEMNRSAKLAEYFFFDDHVNKSCEDFYIHKTLNGNVRIEQLQVVLSHVRTSRD